MVHSSISRGPTPRKLRQSGYIMRIRIWGILSGALGAAALMGWLEQHSLHDRQVTEIREVFKISARELRDRSDAFWTALDRRFPGGKLRLGSNRKLELVPIRNPDGPPGKIRELSAQLQ